MEFEPVVNDFLRLRKSGELILLMPDHFLFFLLFLLDSVPKIRSASTDAALGTGSSVRSRPLLTLAEDEGRTMSM